MCFCLYLGTPSPAPLIPPRSPPGGGRISIEPLHETRQSVKDWFTLPCVMQVGSDVGCGCGFRHNEAAAYIPDTDHSGTQPNHLNLVEVLKQHFGTAPFVELHGCWDGDHAIQPEDRREVCINDLLDENFHFRMKGYCRVRMENP